MISYENNKFSFFKVVSLKSIESIRFKMFWMLKCYENFEFWSIDVICRSVILFIKGNLIKINFYVFVEYKIILKLLKGK